MTGAKKKAKVEKNWLEWIVFGVSLALVAAVLGYLAYDGATAGDAPPAVEVRTGEPVRRGESFVVPVTVTNRGDRTAEGVRVEVLLEGGAAPERGEFTVPFLPRGARREAWVTFNTDPAAGRLAPHVLGYEEP